MEKMKEGIEMGKSKTLEWQAERMIAVKFTPSVKRHDEKQKAKEAFLKENGRLPSATELIVPTIHSYQTKNTYVKEARAFARWVQNNKLVKQMNQAKGYVKEYLETLQARDLAVDSLRTARSALGKMYGIPGKDFGFKMPVRHSGQATKGREELEKDERMERLHGDKLRQLENCGLRRHEANNVTVGQISADFKRISQIKGKGGKVRYVEVLNPQLLKDYVESKNLKPEDKLFDHLVKDLNIHRARRDYAETMYLRLLQEKYDRGENTTNYYRCRDGSGRKYDKDVLAVVSQNLGHNRVRVVVEHYLSYESGFACK